MRSARARHEVPVRGEAQELGVQHQFALAGAIVRHHDRPHLVEQQLPRNAAEPVERALEALDQHRHGLPRVQRSHSIPEWHGTTSNAFRQPNDNVNVAKSTWP
ncbi:MAG: hypothetical protein OXI79_12325 [Gammaproteobacteria bacterium]|nr:hypothetical protein [Gammaproteobacteria bacterium]